MIPLVETRNYPEMRGALALVPNGALTKSKDNCSDPPATSSESKSKGIGLLKH